MSPEKLATIQSALQLQGDIKVTLIKAGIGEKNSDTLASILMDQVLKSDAIRPEIGAIYKELEDGSE